MGPGLRPVRKHAFEGREAGEPAGMGRRHPEMGAARHRREPRAATEGRPGETLTDPGPIFDGRRLDPDSALMGLIANFRLVAGTGPGRREPLKWEMRATV